MCGIAGFLEGIAADSAAKCGARDRLNAMLRTLRHRGPDDWGMAFFGFPAEALTADGDHVTWLHSPGARLALGHQRLSILDLRPEGRQPMVSHDGAVYITFNGEIYNYREL